MELSPQKIRESIHANNLLWRCTFTDELISHPQYDLTYTFGVDTNFMSCAQRLDISDDTESHIQKIERHYKKRNKPASFYIDPATQPSNLEVILIDRGYKEIKDEEEVWWGIDLESLSSIDVPEGLEIVECTTRELFEDHLAAAMKGYGNFRFWASLLSKLFRESRDGVDVKHYVGYFNGEVASCASLGIYGDMGILINTAVVPEFRRKGIHTTMMRHRLMVSKQNGCRIAFYQTDADNESSIGTGKKVGFTETFRRRIYTKDL